MTKVPKFIVLILCVTLFISSCRQGKNNKRIKPIEANCLLDKDDDLGEITIIGSPDISEYRPEDSSSNDLLIPITSIVTPSLILVRKSYTVSYNKDNKIPNWVAWHLTSDHVDGDIKRNGGYQEDESVPSPRATTEDYKGSGWSHGHMCPAADNKWDEKSMMESNLLTNICPQDRGLNSGLWNKIEQDCRKWAKKYGDVYIVCGPILLNREHETIGKNKVVVPEAFFKVILCLQGKPKAIGFIVRNNEGKKKKDQFINTVDDVERITGMDFFPSLPDDIENEVEEYANLDDWK
jgi:endonuclease G